MADIGEKIIGIKTKRPIRRFNILSTVRKIRHLSGKKPKFVEQIPESSSGNNGDIVFFKNKSNFNIVEQFIKQNGEWINIKEGRPSNDNRKVKRFIKAKAVP